MRTLARAALLCASSAVLAVGLAATGGTASAAPNPAGTGQPGVECGEDGNDTRPGRSAEAPGTGSPFIDGFSVAGTHYAGEQTQNTNKGNDNNSVSQYDVACFQVSQHR